MHKFDKKLHTVLQEAAKLSSKTEPMLCVFDLDSTIFNVTKRSQNIVKDLLKDPHFMRNFSKLAEKIGKVEIEHDEWGIKNAVLRVGVNDLEAQKYIRNFWSLHFFSNKYLSYDLPYKGAVDFVLSLYDQGAEISYLTGRDKKRMFQGTVESLKQWGLPIDIERTSLLMKPDKKIKDHVYKTDAFSEIFKNRPHLTQKQVWFFENEPVIIEAVEASYPGIQMVFMDSVHSGRKESPSHLPSLRMNYHKD